MQRVFVSCDRCGKEEESINGKTEMQFWGVQPVLYFPNGDSASTSRHRQEWCRDCVVEIGLLDVGTENRAKELAAAGRPITPAPTFEDLVRELISEEIQAQK